ncbi:MAG: hypothetical protein RL338_1445 [Chloroflexota bacterium]
MNHARRRPRRLVLILAAAGVLGASVALPVDAKPTKSGNWSPSTFDFGQIPVTATKDQTFTLTNTGSATMRKPKATVTGTGVAIVADTCATAVLSTNGTCTVTVRYTAGASALSGTLSTTVSRVTYSATLSSSAGTIPTASAVAAGEQHACALDTAGNIWCWGRNSYGEVGSGDTTDRSTATYVAGLPGAASKVDVGWNHTCALVSGAVWCWGWNVVGQLGNNTNVDSSIPVQVSGLSGVTDIAVGGFHSCALLSSGAMKCWGSNSSGVLGNDSETSSSVPVDPSGLSTGVTTIAAGFWNTCAIVSSILKCWGYNTYGAVGTGSTTPDPVLTPTAVALGGTATAVAVGSSHVCAVVGGGVKCWGWNSVGQLGAPLDANMFTPHPTPASVTGVTTGVSGLIRGQNTTCAVMTAGGLNCWGYNSANQVGDSTTQDRTSPTANATYAGLTSPSALAIGHSFSCAVASGGLRCWGGGASGELGDGLKTNSFNTPVRVVPFN